MVSSHLIEVIIMNKRGVRDPEGETIHKHLILRKGYSMVSSVRTGKYFLLEVNANSVEEAMNIAKEICVRLRIYNPIVHDIEVRPHS
ncbi:phosphoribosylformylglycinamidine synthase subunit PurS [Ignisphaera sp. 4213-co]|uniref:Phosphoribosylformylglycinamidine synthase subunit PurS n=1 Tax=Ignisphaera cupida TaxID=3050454 RepID=A0ABD4Z4T2_9CREN|nr:phosphoribosylformylglycinamidine synthase subunit PurS [Ignisphaera sp. 4213-co]MDK6028214.1 phosphoribosylformylglycinamidine synthase subunit PurS [Ignisphaera sp. 4213-co]